MKLAINDISDIQLSKDDSNKGSDTICQWSNETKGIQVTRFAVSNSRSTSIISQKVAIKILENIYYRIKPVHRTIVSFDSIYDTQNEIVRLKKKTN